MYDITACIVTYHSPLEGVRKAVESFLDTSLDVHLMVVDNASGGTYLQNLEVLAEAYEHVELIEAPRNGGFGYGNNIAILRAPECRYFLCLNPDVVIHDGALETLVAYMDSHEEVGVISPKVLYEDGRLQPLNKRNPAVIDLFLRRFTPPVLQRVPCIRRRMEYYTMMDVGYALPCEVEFLTGCFMLFRKSVLDRAGGFDEAFFLYLEDADITRRIRKFAKALYLPDAVITHSWQRGSHKSWRLMGVMLHSIWVYFGKWGWKAW